MKNFFFGQWNTLPLLLSKKAMNRANMTLEFQTDCTVLGEPEQYILAKLRIVQLSYAHTAKLSPIGGIPMWHLSCDIHIKTENCSENPQTILSFKSREVDQAAELCWRTMALQ